ncbi:hypothetical protein DESC_640013 [Desulfosarcina cetonica]|uniref:hypothetical protein n=1 Tax=Desulfosarcina cetonica TaxID=90730 RepID=UPI0006D212E5|nr:hypothetical protein [Desulfosarcina cetonica]VTR67859.1 hypothetical protein DESC_640013 [Desulfosarcina cetonica]
MKALFGPIRGNDRGELPIANGAKNPYVAGLIGSFRRWLEDEAEVAVLKARLPAINPETICKS